ncbi:MAG: PmoA family protein [Phycisphaerales bacterium]|nr:MAG: PmoA family protein [Phycisphaerales bacterium]
MKNGALASAILVISTLTSTSWSAPNVRLIKGEDKVDVIVGGRLFTSYIYGDDLPKPALVPVCSPSGIAVSRRYPLTKLEGGSDDHLHHVGLFFAVDRVNGTNFWNYYRNDGTVEPRIKHASIQEITSGQGKGTLRTVAHWIDKHGELLLKEDRTMVFLAGGQENEYTIDLSIDLTAQKRKVVFEDIEEGVFAIRLADCLRESDPKNAVRPGQPLPEESIRGTGRYFSSNGDETARQVWGKRARWVALQGVKQGKVVGVAILNHPESINYPTYWHVRDYGLFSANPLGQGDFQRQDKYKKNRPIPLRLTLEPKETVHFRFLFVVYEGVRTKEQLEERFTEFLGQS